MNNKPDIALPLITFGLGLALAFAVADNVKGIDLTMIGYILTGLGALWTIIALVTSRTKATSETVQKVDPHTGSTHTQHVEEL